MLLRVLSDTQNKQGFLEEALTVWSSACNIDEVFFL
jgi:hypothetical protein